MPDVPQTGQPRAIQQSCTFCNKARSPLMISAPAYCAQSEACVLFPVPDGAENRIARPRWRM